MPSLQKSHPISGFSKLTCSRTFLLRQRCVCHQTRPNIKVREHINLESPLIGCDFCNDGIESYASFCSPYLSTHRYVWMYIELLSSQLNDRPFISLHTQFIFKCSACHNAGVIYDELTRIC